MERQQAIYSYKDALWKISIEGNNFITAERFAVSDAKFPYSKISFLMVTLFTDPDYNPSKMMGAYWFAEQPHISNVLYQMKFILEIMTKGKKLNAL